MTAYEQHKAKLKREGYEEAMLDIARKIEETGDYNAGLQWIKDNTKPDDEAHTIVQGIFDRTRDPRISEDEQAEGEDA